MGFEHHNDTTMIRWICDTKDCDETPSASLLQKLGIVDITAVLRSRQLRWYGHVQGATSSMRSVTDLEIPSTIGWGRPRKTADVVCLVLIHKTLRFIKTHLKIFLGTWWNKRLSQGQSRAGFWQQCTSPAAEEQWRWHQWYLYQAQNRTASYQCSTSCGCRSLALIPAASWLDMWAWDRDSCPYRGSGWSCPPSLLGSHRYWKQPPPVVLPAQSFLTSSFQPLSYDARWAISFAVFPLAVYCGLGSQIHWQRGQQLERPQGAHHLATQTQHWLV